MQRMLQMVVQGFLGEMALFTQQTVENSRTFKVRNQEFDQLSEPNRPHPLKPQLSQTFHYFSVCQRWNYCTSLKRMSYLISLHSYARTTCRFQRNPGFCSSRLLLFPHCWCETSDSIRVQQLFYVFSLHFINPLGCLKVPHLILPFDRSGSCATSRRKSAGLCLGGDQTWAQFRSHSGTEAKSSAAKEPKPLPTCGSSWTWTLKQERLTPDNLLLCCCCWRIWRRWVN